LNGRLAGPAGLELRRRVLLGIRPSNEETQGMPGSETTEEWFDVVDDVDAVVSRATRQEMHGRGLRHRAVHVLVFNRAGDLFLQKRSLNKDTAPGAWDSSASGHVGAGEAYDACAVRELREEIGLHAPAPTRWRRLPACDETGQEFVWVYRLEAEGPFTLHPEEIERGAWLAPAEITRLVREQPAAFASSFRLIWQRLAERGDVPG
jgi:isopentenyldiphosphate isomerase